MLELFLRSTWSFSGCQPPAFSCEMLRVADGGSCSVIQSFLCWHAGLNEGDDDLTGAASLLSSAPSTSLLAPSLSKIKSTIRRNSPAGSGDLGRAGSTASNCPSGADPAGPSRAGGGEQSPGTAAAPRLARRRPQPPCCFPSSPLRHRRCGAGSGPTRLRPAA